MPRFLPDALVSAAILRLWQMRLQVRGMPTMRRYASVLTKSFPQVSHVKLNSMVLLWGICPLGNGLPRPLMLVI